MDSNMNVVSATSASTNTALEFLAFRVGAEEYGIDIQKIQELRRYESVTYIANAPDFIKGVINLRGIIVPICDMRIWFNMGAPVYDQVTAVIILNIAGKVIGMVVDSVSDVISLSEDQIRPSPQMGNVLHAQCLRGMGVFSDRMLLLLDIERLMSEEQMTICSH